MHELAMEVGLINKGGSMQIQDQDPAAPGGDIHSQGSK